MQNSNVSEESNSSSIAQSDKDDGAPTKKAMKVSEPVIDRTRIDGYRQHAVDARQKSIDDFDKAVLSLSTAALGVSFAFVKDFIGEGPVIAPTWLMLAWGSWAVSSLSILISFYMSRVTLEYVIKQIDKGRYEYLPGGRYAKVTNFLTVTGGVTYLLGLVLIGYFVCLNVR